MPFLWSLVYNSWTTVLINYKLLPSLKTKLNFTVVILKIATQTIFLKFFADNFLVVFYTWVIWSNCIPVSCEKVML